MITGTRVEYRTRLTNGQTYANPLNLLGWVNGADLLEAVRRVDPGATLEARTVITTEGEWQPCPDPCPLHPQPEHGATDPACTCPAY